jgi:hypothetical protein
MSNSAKPPTESFQPLPLFTSNAARAELAATIKASALALLPIADLTLIPPRNAPVSKKCERI